MKYLGELDLNSHRSLADFPPDRRLVRSRETVYDVLRDRKQLEICWDPDPESELPILDRVKLEQFSAIGRLFLEST